MTLKHLTQTNRGARLNDLEAIEKADMQEVSPIRQFCLYGYVQDFILTLFPELSGEKDCWIILEMMADVMEELNKVNIAELEDMCSNVITGLHLH